MKRWWREPLLHFVLLGAGLFALDAFLSERSAEARERAESGRSVVVKPGSIDSLIARFVKTRQRGPTPQELRELVDDHVLEEVLYREGTALGLDQDDTIVRRRVRQKMEFLVDDLADLVEPTEEDLARWLAEHPDAYRDPDTVSFRQLFLSSERRGEALGSDAESILATLRDNTGPADPRDLADTTLLDHAFRRVDMDVVALTFGEPFAERLAQLPTDTWSGPIHSPFGAHLVIVDERVVGDLPELAGVRDAVLRDWIYEQREQAAARAYRELVESYEVSIEWPADLVTESAASGP